MPNVHNTACELCDSDGGTLIFRAEQWRVVRVDGAEGDAFPGFCRVIWNTHVKEITDLSATERQTLMDAVYKVEAALRKCLAPAKMNLASLGNLTPHLHWHVIPRYADDAAFPRPIWAVDLNSAPSRDTLAMKRGHQAAAGENGAWQHAVKLALKSD